MRSLRQAGTWQCGSHQALWMVPAGASVAVLPKVTFAEEVKKGNIAILPWTAIEDGRN